MGFASAIAVEPDADVAATETVIELPLHRSELHYALWMPYSYATRPLESAKDRGNTT